MYEYCLPRGPAYKDWQSFVNGLYSFAFPSTLFALAIIIGLFIGVKNLRQSLQSYIIRNRKQGFKINSRISKLVIDVPAEVDNYQQLEKTINQLNEKYGTQNP